MVYLTLSSKKGMSALQTHRMIGSGSCRTAWYMAHRLRAGLTDPECRQLMGVVEVDETFIGGKDRNKHWNKRSGGRESLGSGKTAVIGAISRKANVSCQIIENTDECTPTTFVRQTVRRGILGTYHNVSRRHLLLYLSAFVFRFNNRKNSDVFGAAVASC